MLDRFTHAFRQGLRAVQSSPGLSAIVVTTLAVTIAASVTGYSVLSATLFKALPFHEPDRVVFLRHSYSDSGGAASPPLFMDYRRGARTFQSLSAAMPWTANLTGSGDPEHLNGLLVSADFFETLGVTAARGRTFTQDEEQPGRDRIVLLSDGFWKRRFGGDPSVLGSALRLNGEPYQVLGIMPPGFTWGRAYGREGEADVWAPFALTAARLAESNRGNEYLDVYGRLKPATTIAQANADLLATVRNLRARLPNYYTEVSGFRVTPVQLQQDIVQQSRPALVLVFVAVLALLLVAATNVAGLMLTRATGRRREISVRHALGASRGRLTLQCLGEASVLAGAAGGLGLALASLLAGIIDRVDRVALPRARPIEIDGGVLAFAVIATIAVAAVIGLVPAWQLTRSDLMNWLRTASVSSGGRSSARTRRLLVVIQTAVALTLLAGSGLLVRSIARLDSVSLGFQTDAVLTAKVQLPRARYELAAARVEFLDSVLTRVMFRPGVLAAGVISELPMSNVVNSSSFAIDGRVVPPSEKQPHAETWSASPGYFNALRIALIRGRLFQDSDRVTTAQVAVVSQSLANRYFSGVDPVGQRIDFEGERSGPHRWREIVGVVADVHDRRIDRMPGPQIYVPYAQRPTGGLFLITRTSVAPLDTVADLRAAVKAVDPDLPVYGITTLESLATNTTSDRRAVRTALTGFATAAVLLVALGLYGLLAQVVRERVPEIGVRMALGATSADVMRLFLREGGRLVVQGLGIGVVASLAATRLLQGVVFEVTTMDPLTYVTVAALLTVIAGAACLLPAWRAGRLDPLIALRRE
jgi:putative ABC transport system permease protein